MKKLLLLSLISVLASIAYGQNVYKESEFGFGAGGAQYYGDLNQNQIPNYVRYSGSAFLKYNFSNYIALKGLFNYCSVGGDDKLNKNSFERQRNLSFGSNVWDINVLGEFNFLAYTLGDFDFRSTPYINIGAGIMHYNPYAYIGTERYYLRPLGTEGQNLPQFKDRKYSSFAVTLPVGLGYKFWMAKGVTLGGEVLYRFSSTDYLDDVSTNYVGLEAFPLEEPPAPFFGPTALLQDRSVELGGERLGIAGRQRGFSSTKDHFVTAQLTLSFRFQEYRCPR